jgi:5'(3')-deoxyribonucleotidase
VEEMRVALDFDDCLADTSTYILKGLNDHLGTDHEKHHITTYSYEDNLDISSEEFWKVHDELIHASKPQDILPGYALGAVMGHTMDNYELFVLSARSKKFQPKIEEWIQHYFPDKFSGIFVTSGKSKNDAMTLLELDVLVDDSYANIKRLRLINKPGILYDQHHNKHEHHKHRATNWFDVARILYNNPGWEQN